MTLPLDKIIDANRNTLRTIPDFITDVDYNASPDNYGLPSSVKLFINDEVDKTPTYVDLLMFLQQFLKSPHRTYVEIGVSVLKSFYQAANFLTDSSLCAFDINSPNPTIANRFDLLSRENTCSFYRYNSNKITYFQGDVFKEDDLLSFGARIGSKVDLIFSDAHHTGAGLKSEYDFFIRDSLADSFILYYDDLDSPDMNDAFLSILNDMQRERGTVYSAFIQINGWLGQHERAHLNGIITSVDFPSLLKESLSIPYQLLTT